MCMNLYYIYIVICELESEMNECFRVIFFTLHSSFYIVWTRIAVVVFLFLLSQFFFYLFNGGGDFIFILDLNFCSSVWTKSAPIHTKRDDIKSHFLEMEFERTEKKKVSANEVNECSKVDFFSVPFSAPRRSLLMDSFFFGWARFCLFWIPAYCLFVWSMIFLPFRTHSPSL